MGRWTIRVDDGQMSELRNYGSCYKHAAVPADSLSSAAKLYRKQPIILSLYLRMYFPEVVLRSLNIRNMLLSKSMYTNKQTVQKSI